MSRHLKKIMLVAPAYNEESVLPGFLDAFASLRKKLEAGFELRLVVVNDGSTDRTEKILQEAANQSSSVVGFISFTGNFGHQAALIAGLAHVAPWADAIVTIDCDLEHPVDLIPKLIDEWMSQDCAVVNTIREDHAKVPWLKRTFSSLFYRIAARLTGLALRPGQADFRLWDARVLRSISNDLPNIASLRLFAAWLPGPKRTLHYKQNFNAERRSRFTLRKNWELAVTSIVRYSSLPLKTILLVGLAGLFTSAVYGTYVINEFLRGRTVPGWTSLVLVVLGMGSLQLIAFGVLAVYLQRIVFSKDLPTYVVKNRSDLLT